MVKNLWWHRWQRYVVIPKGVSIMQAVRDNSSLWQEIRRDCAEVNEWVDQLFNSLPSNQLLQDGTSRVGVTGNLELDLSVTRSIFEGASDLVVRRLRIGHPAAKAAVIYLDGMADSTLVTEAVLGPLIVGGHHCPNKEEAGGEDDPAALVTVGQFDSMGEFGKLTTEILKGNTVLLIDGQETAWVGETTRPPSRSVERSQTDSSVIGPQDGFTEDLKTNLGLLRKRVKCPELVIEPLLLGRRSRTEVRLLFVNDIANPSLVAEVRQRLEAINRDMVLAAGHIKDLIIENPYSLFPMIEMNERPDTVAASLAEGRIAVMVDNDPFVLLLPSSFFYAFAAVEDHYLRFYLGTAVRLLRLTAFFLSTFLTPLYVGITNFHLQLIPLPFLLNIAASGLGTPFPLVLSAFMVEFVLEIFREAGIRLPERVGRAVGIVGAIVLGQAAVQAGFVPPALIIVSAMGAIVSFAVPGYEITLSMRLVRFPLLLLASVLGFFGVGFGAAIIALHLGSLKCFGVPFLSFAELAVKAPPQRQDSSHPYSGANGSASQLDSAPIVACQEESR